MNEFGAGFAGILSRKGRENPTFNDWNAVLVVYCDGGLYAGARGAYTANLTSPFFLEGHASLASVIHDLRLRGLGSARNVLFSGCSAGAQAVAMTCDAMARALPSASVKCLMDAGFFLDTPDIQGRLTWRQSVERLFKFHRMGLGIPPACRQGHSPPPAAKVSSKVIAHGARHSPLASPPLSNAPHVSLPLPPFPSAHAQQPWKSHAQQPCKCLLPQYNLPFLRTPLLVVNSLQDEIAVKMTLPCPTLAPPPSLPPSRLLPSSHSPPPPSPPFLPPPLPPTQHTHRNPGSASSRSTTCPSCACPSWSTRAAAMEVPASTVQPAIPPHAAARRQQPTGRDPRPPATYHTPTPRFPIFSPTLTAPPLPFPSFVFPLSPASPHTAHAQEPWKCLLPQYNLPFLRTPLMVVNSLQDEIAVKMTFAPPLINGSVRIQKCMDNSPLCPAPYRTALHRYQGRLARTVLGIQRVKRQQGVWFESFLMNSTAHCSAVYGEWVGKVDVLGRQLPRVVEEWFFHGKGGGAGRTGGVGAGKSGVGAGAGGADVGAGGVGKGGAGAGGAGGPGKAGGSSPTRPAGSKGASKGGWAGGRQGGAKPKAPGVQTGSAGPGKVVPGTGGAGKVPGTGGADQMGAGGSQGGEKGAGGAAGKGQQQQGAGKSVVKQPGTGIGKGPGVGAGAGAGAGKAPGGQRGALWPGVKGVRGKGRGGLAGTSSEEQVGGRSHRGGGKSGMRKKGGKGKGGRKGRKSGKRRGGTSGRKGGGKSAGRGVGSKEGGRRSEAHSSGPEAVIVTEECGGRARQEC
ncbi:unnamed protein product [Closterium sp. Naga37s-1]|nr:unnamed protein product [Closterium sp. Naga37s-1]